MMWSFSSWPGWFVDLIPGLLLSLKVTGTSLLIAIPFGLLLALGVSGTGPLRFIPMAVVEVIRGVPGIVLLYLIYYGGPSAHLTLSSFVAAVCGLGFGTGAYMSEIFRAGLLAVPRGQREAARALGLSPWSELSRVVLPQALRIIAPPLLGAAILLFQGTSLAYVIALPELLSRAYNIGFTTFRFLAVLTLAGLMYLIIVVPSSHLVRRMETRDSSHR